MSEALQSDNPIFCSPKMSVRLATHLGEKTVHRDIEKLVEMELVIRSGYGYITNIDSLRSMMAKRKHPNRSS
jgi:DeoR/GlpR family transcriptional regulator of sugar metabolism